MCVYKESVWPGPARLLDRHCCLFVLEFALLNQYLDANMKRGAYIGETIELLNVFKSAHPLQKLTAVQTYACSFYGSNLWDLYGSAACQVYRAWQVTVRDAWEVSRQTRTYIVDNLLSGTLPHIKQLILRRYVRFAQNLVKSENPIISGLAYWAVRTKMSTTGKNVANIQDELNVDPLKCESKEIIVKKREIPDNGEETIELLVRLFNIKSAEVDPEMVIELSGLIDNVCEQ